MCLKQQKLIFSQLWGRGVQGQGVAGLVSPEAFLLHVQTLVLGSSLSFQDLYPVDTDDSYPQDLM